MSRDEKRIAVVTGAARGIGLEVARGLAARGDHVVLAVRDVPAGERAAAALGGGEVLPLDLADLASVRRFGEAFRARHDRLHVLVNNAGIHAAERVLTQDGIELTMATNHVGHFLLTKLLEEPLRAAAPSRVVNVASEAHRFARRVEPRHLVGEGRWSGLLQYCRSKLANLLFTYALARRLDGSGVVANAVHPGSVRSGWARGQGSGAFRFVARAADPFLIAPERGARTPLHAATAPELEGVSGRYFVRRRERASSGPSRDEAAQEALWRATEAIIARAAR